MKYDTIRIPCVDKTMTINQRIQHAAHLIRAADALIITAGAGMGVDSGLPDFRGAEGFWGAYPALCRAKICFEEIACPQAFVDHPKLAWGFYGHRLNVYRTTPPNEGFQILGRIAETMPYGNFVFTSNVDGHFQNAGFPAQRICEVHGSIHHLQCLNGCKGDIWHVGKLSPVIEEDVGEISSGLPHCPHCGETARPNILMFGDLGWLNYRQATQMASLRNWLSNIKNPVVIEVGAGSSIPTVRRFGEAINCSLIRINLRESEVSRPGDIGIPLGGLETLRLLAQELNP
jgi:NAD-dependent SIR2 family protein deacetylase